MGEHRQSADDFRNKAVGTQVLRSYILDEVVTVDAGSRLDRSISHHLSIQTVADITLDAFESATADEEDIVGVDSYHLLLGVLAATLRRHVNHAALDNFQQGLLHTFSRNVAGD